MRKLAFIAVLALVGVTGSALAAKPAHPTHPVMPASTNASANASSHGQSATVLFVLRGTLGAYTAASGSTNGSIAITVTSANHEGSLLKTTLTFPVSSSTKIVGTVTSGHNGIVKVRAAKNASAAALQTMTAFQVIDQGASA